MARPLVRRTPTPGRSRPGAAKRRASRPAPRRGLWVGLLALACLAGLSLVLWRRPPPPPPPAAAERLSALEAEAVGSRLSGDGHHLASLPYYRRIADEYRVEWVAHANYSSALHNASQESRSHLGSQAPAIRSSIERMAMVEISNREQELAERYAGPGADRALALFQGGQTLQTWGFPIEALVEYRRALEHAPDDPQLIRVENALALLLAGGVVEGRGR